MEVVCCGMLLCDAICVAVRVAVCSKFYPSVFMCATILSVTQDKVMISR